MTPCLIDVQIATDQDDLPDAELLGLWVDTVLAHHPQESRQEITVRFVSSEESHQLNHTYRDRASSTNVLSFPFEAPPQVTLPLLGDLVICPEVVIQEAQAQGKPLRHHYAHMVIHGVLHLLGYDHLDDDEAELMESIERELLAELDVADPYLQIATQ